MFILLNNKIISKIRKIIYFILIIMSNILIIDKSAHLTIKINSVVFV